MCPFWCVTHTTQHGPKRHGAMREEHESQYVYKRDEGDTPPDRPLSLECVSRPVSLELWDSWGGTAAKTWRAYRLVCVQQQRLGFF